MTTTYDCSHMSNHIWLITYDHFCWYMIAHIWPHVYDHICDTHMIAIFCSHMSAHIWSYASMSNVCWYMMLVYECSHMIAHIWSYACTHMWCWYMSSHMNIPLSHIRFPIEMLNFRHLTTPVAIFFLQNLIFWFLRADEWPSCLFLITKLVLSA